jgi:signal transduction histidine kinase/phage shock protein PspC (stress-responsive transcriptional regulator)
MSRRVHRSTADRWVAGVCGGLAEHLGQPAWLIRGLFVVTALLGGVGVVAYALMWLFLPLESDDGRARASVAGRSTGDLSGLLGFVALGLGVLMALSVLGVPVRVSVWAPVILVGAGVAVLWRQGDEAQRRLQPAPLPGSGPDTVMPGLADRGMWVRVLVGLVLLMLGVVGIVVPRIDLLAAARALLAAGAVVAGLGVIALPWVSAWVRGRQAERYAAIRAQERASMAARVHDSVLQTLTLIQRRADDPKEVVRLARAEERALRSWLYAPVGESGSLAAALAGVVASTEADYDVRIDLVTVGDAVVDDRMAAVVAATREAVVNAAKHAGAPATVYAEVGEREVEVNVRDRGRGFDPGVIDGDRHGVRQSIVARVESVGGRATVRSTPGEGTEVRLTLPMGGDRG